MSEEIEQKIRTLNEIRRDVQSDRYLNTFKATQHICFLLAIIDELTDALLKIHQIVQEGKKLDPNIDPSCKHNPDALAS